MKAEYLPTFIRDLKTLKKSPIYESIRDFAFQEITIYESLSEISNVMKLKSEGNAYRLRIGNYRIGFFIEDNTIIFAHVLHRKEFYRYFP
jgi:mRNA interferase RelE/StbE